MQIVTPTTPKRLNIALIGTEMVAATHLNAIAALPEKVCLQGVLSKQRVNSQRFAHKASEELGYHVSCYTNIEQLCKDKLLDFAILATPPNARTGIVHALAQSGKHILMEKPIERSLSAAQHIVDTCEQHAVKLGVVFQHRMRDGSVKLSELLHTGSLGSMHIIEVFVPWWREQSYYNEAGRGTYERDGGGVLISQAIHTLDLMLNFTGPVYCVQAMASTSGFHVMESEDYISAGLKFQNGAIGSLIASTANFPGAAERIVLHCERGVAHLGSGVLEVKWRNGKVDRYGQNATTGGGADPMAFTHQWHQSILNNFADAIIKQQEPIASGKSSLAVHRLIDALLSSSDTQSLCVL